MVQWLTSSSNASDVGLIPGRGTKILHASQPKQNRKQKQYCSKFNKDLKKKWSTSKNLKNILSELKVTRYSILTQSIFLSKKVTKLFETKHI